MADYTREELMEIIANKKKAKPQGRSAESYKMASPKLSEIEVKLPFSKGVNENIAGAIHGANRAFSKTFGWGQHQKDMQKNYDRSMELNPTATRLGHIGADVYSSLPFMAAGGGAANLLGLGGRAAGAVGGGLGGGAMSAFSTPEEGETRLGNILFGAGLGAAGGALFPGITRYPTQAIKGVPGEIAQGAMSAAKGVGKYGESLSQGRTADKMLKHYNQLTDKFRKGYGEILNNPKLEGKIKLEGMYNEKTADLMEKAAAYSPNLKKAFKSGKLEDIHWAASDLGRLVNKISKKGIDATPEQREILKAAKPIQQQLEGVINKALDKQPGLKEAYRNLDKAYGKEMGPISQHIRSGLKQYEKGKILPRHVLRRTKGAKAEEYQTAYENMFPGMHRAKFESPLLNAGAHMSPYVGGGLGLYGLKKGYDFLNPQRKDNY